MPDASKTSERISRFRESLLNSKFAETIVGTDWHCQDIATSEERTSPETGIAVLLVSAVAVVASITALIVWWSSP